jgi:hypothetical protein
MLAFSQGRVVQPHVLAEFEALPPRRSLTEADAVDIWIARWLGIRRKHLLARYGCDPRRLYEVWEGVRFPGSRDKAKALFALRHPTLVDRVDYGTHRRIPRRVPAELQPGLFDGLE